MEFTTVCEAGLAVSRPIPWSPTARGYRGGVGLLFSSTDGGGFVSPSLLPTIKRGGGNKVLVRKILVFLDLKS